MQILTQVPRHRPLLEIDQAVGEKPVLNTNFLRKPHRKELDEFRGTFSDKALRFVSANMPACPKAKVAQKKIEDKSIFC